MNNRTLLLVAIPSAIYIGHAAMYWHWIIDDAGISIAYAQNLVAGHGLVSQPGTEPVEGFSNPLWTFLIALSMAVGLFSTYSTIKLLSFALTVATFVSMLRFCRMTMPRHRADIVFLGAAVITTCCPSFVIWTSSGLENSLLAALALALVAISTSWALERRALLPLWAGIVAGLLALTRPDALVYSAAFPIVAAMAQGVKAVRPIGLYLAALLAICVPYEIFRITYFGDFVPNTFHAKPGTHLTTPLFDVLSGRALLAAMTLFEAGIPPAGWICAALFAAAPILYLFLRNTEQRLPMVLLYLFLVLSFFAYLALPQDWMGEYRFATVLFPVSALFFLTLASSVIDAARVPDASRTLIALATMLTVLSMPNFVSRASAFSKKPTAPLADISRSVGMTFNWYKQQFGLSNASLLSPDIGGALMHSELQVLDMAGLCDKTIGRLIYRDQQSLRDYILSEKRPTFVYMHSVWRDFSGLPNDPRFLSDYLQLSDVNWVRRDAISAIGEEKALEIAANIPSFDPPDWQ